MLQKHNIKFRVPSKVFALPNYYRELGYFLWKLEYYERGLKFFDISLSKQPDDMRALRGRSLNRALACKYQDAFKDIETMLQLDPDNIYVLANKASVTYLCCEFEDSMIQNTRLSSVRIKPDNFILGVMCCTDAINNNIGLRAGKPLRDHFKIIRKNAWDKIIQMQKPPEPIRKKKKKVPQGPQHARQMKQPAAPNKKLSCKDPDRTLGSDTNRNKMKTKRASLNVMESDLMTSRQQRNSIEAKAKESDMRMNFYTEGSSIADSLHSEKETAVKIPPSAPFPYRPIQNLTTNIQNYMAERYLNKMYLDKLFLKEMCERDGLSTPNKTGGKKIKSFAKAAYKYIHYNQELLRARRPFYFLRLQDSKLGGKMKERRFQRERLLINYCAQEADNMIDRMHRAIDDRNLQELLELADKLILFCENTPKKVLEGRDLYMHTLYNLVRDGFYLTKSFKPGMTDEEKNGRVAVVLDFPESRQPSVDSFANQMKDHFLDWNKLIKSYENRVRNAETIEETVWYYHELSRFYSAVNSYEMAKSYATKCLKDSYMIKDYRWIINAQFLLVKINISLRDKNGAKLELRHAQRIAHMLEDQDLLEFITKALDVLKDCTIEMVQGTKMLDIRKDKILQILRDPRVKNEASNLFNKMSSLPDSRKMSLIPGITYDKKQSRKSKKISSSESEDEDSKASGPSRAKARGVEFMNLIQYHIDA